jgi:hypothetical protein
VPKQIKKPSRTKHDGYAEFVSQLSLRGIGLDESTMRLDRNKLFEAKHNNLNLINEITGGQSVLAHTENSFSISGKYLLETKLENGEVPLRIDCTFSALFATSTRARTDHLQRFANNEARVIFWPYLRHFFSDVTYRMSIDVVIIPLTTENPGAAKAKE